MANRPIGVPIRVVRMARAQVVSGNGAFMTVPAIELTYSFVHGDRQWVFAETRIADRNGIVNLDDTLWAELEREGGYELLQRSGSF